MRAHRLRRALPIILAVGAAACGSADPYVYKHDEFDRNSPAFNKQPADLDEVTICYNAIIASDARLLEMAERECGKFGKAARDRSDSFGRCPLLTPVEAHFLCVMSEAE